MQLTELIKKSDKRGTLVEAFKFPNDGQLFYIVVPPFETRGHHYHKRKTETFLVVWGAAHITSRDRTTDNVMSALLVGTNPISAKIPPNHTHSVTATDKGAVILVWVDEQFNESDADTIAEEV